MAVPDRHTYLKDLILELLRTWPDNRTVNFVCHGHSVPAGYSATPFVDTFHAYPHLWHVALKSRFPFAVLNVIVSAIGGEHSEQGADRFERDVLAHRPDLVTIDYGLNARRIGLERAMSAWRSMIEAARKGGARVILLTPTHDEPALAAAGDIDPSALPRHAEAIRELAHATGSGLADSTTAFDRAISGGTDRTSLLSWTNHPNERGHTLVVEELMRGSRPTTTDRRTGKRSRGVASTSRARRRTGTVSSCNCPPWCPSRLERAIPQF
jgi:acyl-CoA thioesterase-1